MPRTLTIREIEGKPGKVYYPLELKETPKPTPGPGEVLVRLRAAALNHRDHFIRQHLYPGIGFGCPLLADGVGVIDSLGPPTTQPTTAGLLKPGTRVLLTPSRGWASDPAGPEDDRLYAVAGGTRVYPEVGYAQDWIAVPAAEVEVCPAHLSDAEAAALPLAGLTAWRALVTKANLGLDPADPASGRGRHVLVTGVGGGVALAALQLAVAFGCDVWVTSSSGAKIARAVGALGARGGVLYRDEEEKDASGTAAPTTTTTTTTPWDQKLASLLPPERPHLDAVIDGAGGDIMARTVRLLRPGGVVVSYGMTLGPRMDWAMPAVMRNVELRGTTMGSRAEFAAMVAFVAARRLAPVVSRVARRGLGDLAAVDGLFAEMRAGRQFGKLVVEISSPGGDGDDGEEEDGGRKKIEEASAKL